MLSIKKVWILKLATAFFALIASIYIAQWIAEKFFFDKFFYQKIVKYGYGWKKGIQLKDFGKRAADVLALKNNPESLKSQESLFTIAIIGDSYVWGTGIRNEERFAVILEKQIKKIRPARVLSLALPGDSLLDDSAKYQILMTHSVHVDFFVFGLVENDLILSKEDRYKGGVSAEQSFGCPGPFVYIPKPDPTVSAKATYEGALAQSFDISYGNLCLFNKIASLLPKNNAVYMTFYPQGSIYLKIYMKALRDHGLEVITPTDFPKVYDRYRNHDPAEFQVSKKETHPSALANRMFAEMLLEELTNRGFLASR